MVIEPADEVTTHRRQDLTRCAFANTCRPEEALAMPTPCLVSQRRQVGRRHEIWNYDDPLVRNPPSNRGQSRFLFFSSRLIECSTRRKRLERHDKVWFRTHAGSRGARSCLVVGKMWTDIWFRTRAGGGDNWRGSLIRRPTSGPRSGVPRVGHEQAEKHRCRQAHV